MKYVKMLGLLAVAAAALMAFAGSASATVLKSTGVNLGVGATISAQNESKHVSLTGPIGIAIECEESKVSGSISNAGGTNATVKGNITALSFKKCTNGYEVHVNILGTLEAHAVSPTGNATVTSSSTTVTVTNVPFAGTCAYRTENTDIGLLTGDLNTPGAGATFDISATIPRHGGSGLCGSSGTWEGNYLITSPHDLNAH